MPPPFSVAVLSPAPTWPLDYGNRKRIRRVCHQLQELGGRISFILYALEDDWRRQYPRYALEEMRRQWEDVHLIIPTVPYHPAARGLDHHIDEWWDPAIGSFLDWYFRARRPDAIVVNYPYLSKALDHAPSSCLRILDMHDRFGDRRDLLAGLGVGSEFFHTTPEEEAKALSRADLALAIKDEEAVYFRSICTTPVFTLPHIDPISSWNPTTDEDGYLRIGLLGARNSVNVTNTRRFLDIALPRITAEMAPIRVVLGGSMCRDLSSYAGHPLVTMLGSLEHIATFYESIDVSVVPIEQSSGQKIRVGEALSLAVPILAHRHAFEGYVPSHRLHQVDSLDGLVDACIELSFDRSALSSLSAASHSSRVRTEEKSRAAIESIARLARSHVPSSLFVVPVAALSEQPELRLHIVSAAALAGSYSRMRVLLTGGPPTDDLAPLISVLRSMGQVFAVERGQPEVDAVVADSLELVASLETVDVWCYDESQLATLADRQLNVLVSSGFPPGERSLRLLPPVHCAVEGRVGLVHVPSRNRADPLRVRQVFPLGLISDHAADVLPEMLEAEPVDAALVVSDTAADPLVAIILAILQSARVSTTFTAPTEVLDGLGALLRHDRLDRGWSLRTMETPVAREWLRSQAPRLVFDCAVSDPDIEASMLIVDVHARRGLGGKPWRASYPGKSVRLDVVVRDILEYVRSGSDQRLYGRTRAEDGSVYLYNQRSLEFLRYPITA